MSQDYVRGFVDDVFAKQLQSGKEMWNIVVDGNEYGYGMYPPKFGVGSEIEFDIRWNGEYPNVNWDTMNIIDNQGEAPKATRGGGRSQGGGGGGGYNRGGQSGGGGQRQGQGGGQRQGGGYNGQRGGQSGGGQRQSPSQGQRAPASTGQRQPQPPARSPGGGMSKDDYWSRKEERDLEVQKAIQYQASRNAAIAVLDVMLKAGAVKLPSKQADQYDAVLAVVDEITAHFNTQTSNLGNAPTPTLGDGYANQQADDDLPDDDGLPQYQE